MKTKFLRILALLIVLGLSMFSFVACGKCQHSSTSDWIVDCDATCLTEGLQHKECSDCSSIVEVALIKKTTCNYIEATCKYCQEEYYSKGLHFILNSDGETYSVVGIGTASDKDIVIPSTYNGKKVTRIGKYAFNYDGNDALQNRIVSIKIPATIKVVEKLAFYCTNTVDGLTVYCDDGVFWANLSIEKGNNCLSRIRFYSETPSTNEYWHYVDGVPVPWDMS